MAPFMAYFRFTLVLFVINSRFDQKLRTIAQNDQYNLKIISRKKNWSLGSNYKFWVFLGQISKLA